VTGNPIKLAESPPEPHDYPPALGADTAAILKELLNLTPAEITGLMQRRVVLAA
jgi:crotonobetainyl-CoA:carnitine CoA-transferase CaiB-like acyl-CoA transferase